MLTIKNKDKIKGIEVFKEKITYYIEGVYEYPESYSIHLRSYDKGIVDEVLILKRNTEQAKELGGVVYTFYDMYDSNKPKNRNGLTSKALQNKLSVIHAIEHIINK